MKSYVILFALATSIGVTSACQKVPGHCLPHQNCNAGDCCSLGTSCETCPNGSTANNLECSGKGNYKCNEEAPKVWTKLCTSCDVESSQGQKYIDKMTLTDCKNSCEKANGCTGIEYGKSGSIHPNVCIHNYGGKITTSPDPNWDGYILQGDQNNCDETYCRIENSYCTSNMVDFDSLDAAKEACELIPTCAMVYDFHGEGTLFRICPQPTIIEPSAYNTILYVRKD